MKTLLDEFKEYVRVDGDDENQSLSTFLSTAQLVLKNSGVKLPEDYYLIINEEDVYAEHRLAVLVLASHFYENRQISSQNAQNQIPFSVQTLILQLKWVKIDESSAI